MSIMLSFGGSSANGAWDDRELVSAYDTAMEEFHAHHPGPGSWLDKVTAQKELEKQAGPSSHPNPAWYTAPETTDGQQEEEEPEVPLPRPKKRPKKQDHHSRSSENRPPNPYTSSATIDDQAGGHPASPQYSPPSPESAETSSTNQSYVSMPLLGDRNHGVNGSPIPAASGSAVQHYPPPPAPISVAPTTDVSSADALSYAMTSQYWAGYWMGVSQAVQQQESGRSAVDQAPAGQLYTPQSSDPSSRSNVVVSKHRVLKR